MLPAVSFDGYLSYYCDASLSPRIVHGRRPACYVRLMHGRLGREDQYLTHRAQFPLLQTVEKRVIYCKRVLKKKRNVDGSLDKYKARLFKRGNQYSESWADTFAPVVDFMIFRLLLSISAQKDWHVQQINLSNAVMQNKMMREVWMQSPKLFDCVAAFQVCLLRKSLYRLRDAPRVRVSSGCVAEVGIKAHAVRALRNRDIVC